jgi:GT2 family glycosyltransferase
MPVVNSHEDDDGWQVAADLPEQGLTEIWSAGSAGMLIRRRVFDAIDDPWFTPAPDAVGLNEDINFCRKVRAAGFQIWCDPAALLGHIANYTVYPKYADGRWELEHVFDQHTRIPIRRLDEVPA